MKQSIVHIYLYGLIKRKAEGKIIHISKIHPIVKWVIRFPRKYQIEVINELVFYGLLKKIDRDNYEIITHRIRAPIDSLGEPLW